MNIRVWVGTSRIAGKELFAAQHINKGTRIIQYIGQRISKEETADRLYQGNQYLFEFNDRYNIDGKTPKNQARYINHSCTPPVPSLRAWRDEAQSVSHASAQKATGEREAKTATTLPEEGHDSQHPSEAVLLMSDSVHADRCSCAPPHGVAPSP